MNRYDLVKAGVDVKEGIERFNKSKELYFSMLSEFPKDSYFFEMKTALEEGNKEEAFRTAHAFKGICGNLSLKALHTLLVPMVEELRSGEIEKAVEMLDEVEAAYRTVVDVINRSNVRRDKGGDP